jgi:hypothetical protein
MWLSLKGEEQRFSENRSVPHPVRAYRMKLYILSARFILLDSTFNVNVLKFSLSGMAVRVTS